LFNEHRRLPRWVAKRVAIKRELDRVTDDMVQEAQLGMLEAVRGFDLSRQVAFSTYAVVVISHRLNHWVDAEKNRPQAFGLLLDVPTTRVVDRRQTKLRKKRESVCPDPFRPILSTADAREVNHYREADARAVRKWLLPKLPERKRRVVAQFYGIDCDKMTAREIADLEGVSEGAIEQLLHRIRKRLRKHARER
jgi:RNA polymerase sigma factor (sigma-70 family)